MFSTLRCRRLLLATVFSLPSWAGPGDPPTLDPTWSGFVQVGVQRGPASWTSSYLPSTKNTPTFDFLVSRGRFFASSQRGLGFELVKGESITVTGGVGYFLGRLASESDRLHDLGNVKGSTGGLVTLDWRALGDALHVYSFLNSTCRQNRGSSLTLGAVLGFPVNESCKGWMDVSGRFADRTETTAFFGVTPLQSERSGLQEFHPKGGHLEDRFTIGLVHRWSSQWSVSGYLGASMLRGDAAHSPVIERNSQPLGGIVLRRTF